LNEEEDEERGDGGAAEQAGEPTLADLSVVEADTFEAAVGNGGTRDHISSVSIRKGILKATCHECPTEAAGSFKVLVIPLWDLSVFFSSSS